MKLFKLKNLFVCLFTGLEKICQTGETATGIVVTWTGSENDMTVNGQQERHGDMNKYK